MMPKLVFASVCLVAMFVTARAGRGLALAESLSSDGPVYSAAGELKIPDRYREWVFLSSGIGMTYGPAAAMAQFRPQMFDNVFVNPDAYRDFIRSGKWPDKTMFVLEVRNSESSGSINKAGSFQTDLAALEVEVKDSASPAGQWSFYNFPVSGGNAAASAKAIPGGSSCHTCHAKNGAVEQTFVQFYPQLLQVARQKGTVNASFEGLPLNATELSEQLNHTSWTEVQSALEQIKQKTPAATVLREGLLNSMAFRLMQTGKPGLAASLLTWASAQYPTSANLQDSLAEAYLAAGDKQSAQKATARTRALLDADKGLPPATRKAIEEAIAKRQPHME